MDKRFIYRGLRNWKYQLTEPYAVRTGITLDRSVQTEYIYVSTKGLISLRKGYAWDGATGFIDFKWIMRGSLVHDAILQLIHQDGLLPRSYRKEADKVLRQMCIEDGAPKWLAALVYAGVRSYAFARYRA